MCSGARPDGFDVRPSYTAVRQSSRGTELVIEHIETKWCPTILSSDLSRVVPGSDNPRSESQTSQRRG